MNGRQDTLHLYKSNQANLKMNWVGLAILLLACPGGVLLGWGQQRNQSGVKIGSGSRQVTATNPTNVRGGSGIKLGGASKGRNYSKPTTTTAEPEAPPAPVETPAPPSNPSPPYSPQGLPKLNVSRHLRSN